MTRRGLLIGSAAGLAIGLGVLAFIRPPGPVAWKPLAEDSGRILRVVMQYAPESGDDVAETYRQFLRALGPGAEVIWVAENEDCLGDLRARLGDAYPAKSSAVLTGNAITTWSKDRFTCLASGDRALFLAPARRILPNPLRTNDQEVPWRVASAFPQRFACREVPLDFDGGDILATTRGVFVQPWVVSKNEGAPARERIRAELGDVVWLGPDESDVPPHHIGMFLTIANGVAFVGDVHLAESLAAGHEKELAAACEPAGGLADNASRAELARRLDRVAAQVSSLGLRVVRVPLVPSATERSWMSWNNGILEARDGRVRYYMPAFGMKLLDDASAQIFRREGLDLLPIDCSRVWRLSGSLHCLVNVVARS